MIFKKTLLVAFSIMLLLTFSACGKLLGTLASAADAMPTPVPLVVTPVPVITYSKTQTMPLPDDLEIPAGYTRIETQDSSLALFAFTDSSGTIQYRVFGGYNELVNGGGGGAVFRVLSVGRIGQYSCGSFRDC